jgi:O-antigen ligase/Flp pilus assembly protein TadD
MNFNRFSEKFLLWGLYFILLTPLLFQQSLLHPLIVFKTIIFQLTVEVLLAFYVFLAIFNKNYRPQFTAIKYGLLLLLLILIVSGFFSPNLHRAFWSVPERMTGLFLWLHLAAFFLMLGHIKDWIKYLSFSVGVSFAVALLPVVQIAFPEIFFDKVASRLSGTIGNPIFLAAYLLFHVFIALWLAYYFWKRQKQGSVWWFTAIAAFNMLVVLLTQTRGALLGLAAGFFVLAFHNRRTRYWLIYGLIFLTVFAGVFWLTKEAALWQNVPVLSRFALNDLGIAPRLVSWQVAWEVFRERPLLGWGWENFYYPFNSHYRPQLLEYGFGETRFDKPHNLLLEFLATTGLLGAAAYIFLLVLAFRKSRHLWVRAALVAYLAQNFFAFDTLTSYLMFFVILGFVEYAGPEEEKSFLAPAPPWSGAVLILLVLMSLAPVYFFNYRVWRASWLEYQSINYILQKHSPEGIDHFYKALAAPTIYSNYIRRDLAPNIPQWYKDGVDIPDFSRVLKWAFDQMQMAIDKDPLNYSIYLSRADMATTAFPFDQSYLDQAEKDVQVAEKLAPRHQSTLYVLSKIKYLRGDTVGAIDTMKQAIDLNPDAGDPYFYYVLLLFSAGNKEEALLQLQKSVDLGRYPKNGNEARILAGYVGDAGDYNKAEYYYQRALSFNAKDVEAKMKLGLVYYFQQKPELAKKYIGEVMKVTDLSQSPQYQSIKPILQSLGLAQ